LGAIMLEQAHDCLRAPGTSFMSGTGTVITDAAAKILEQPLTGSGTKQI